MVLLCTATMKLFATHEVINPITDSMIIVNFCQKKRYVIIFTTDDMVSKFEFFPDPKLDTVYTTKAMRT